MPSWQEVTVGDLSVTVRLNGEVVEDRALRVERMVRIGEADDAEVSFPGADLTVVRAGRRLLVRGRALQEGDTLDLSLGPVEVCIEHTLRGSIPSELASVFDRRFLVVVALVTAAGTWLDAASSWIERNPLHLALQARAHDTSIVQGEASVQRTTLGPGTPAEAGLPTPSADVADGPRHLPDDDVSGTGWYAWYRRAVPEDAQVLDAYARLQLNPLDAAAHRVVARAAYSDDEYDAAVWHYRWLVGHSPEDRDALLRLARSERRRGRHASEIELYERILEVDPTSVDALGGLAVALARLGRLDEAWNRVDELQAVAPMAPVTDLTVATLAALRGEDREALDALDRAIASRGQFSDEMQLELRRDLALDPVFADLRKGKRLRALLHRHMGAAAPIPTRGSRG